MSKYSTDHKRATLDKAAAQLSQNSGGKISHAEAKKRLIPVMKRIDRKEK